jgi:hypothetical protein
MNFFLLSTVAFGSPSAPKISPPSPAPPPPTVDQAVQNQRQLDIIRQRRGAAANVLAGNAPQTPMTGVTKLLGS